MMHGQEKSRPVIVAMKPPNNSGQPAAEGMERRAGAEGNAAETDTRRAQNRGSVPHGQDRVGQTARLRKKERFTTLLHHIDVESLREAFRALRRKAAAGVDGMVWEDYEAGLEARLADLHERVHRGAYRAQPSRRGDAVTICAPDRSAWFCHAPGVHEFFQPLLRQDLLFLGDLSDCFAGLVGVLRKFRRRFVADFLGDQGENF